MNFDSALNAKKFFKTAIASRDYFTPHKTQQALVHPRAMQLNRYQFINFGYFGSHPSVSRLTANDSAFAAHVANVSYLDSHWQEKEAACNSKEVVSCLQGNGVFFENGNSDEDNLQGFQKCYQSICAAQKFGSSGF